jgi:hypothetical protein
LLAYFERFLPKQQGQMSATTELRWFYPGTLPVVVQDWFSQSVLGQFKGAWNSRKDAYLLLPAYRYLNLKLRQNRLEVKLRFEQTEIQRFGHCWAGTVEQWVKWGSADSTPQGAAIVDCAAGASADQPVWVEVEKQRSQRRYHLSGANIPQALPLSKRVQSGCNLEITRLKVQEQDWWTLAMEAFGEPKRQQEMVVAIATWLSQTPNSPTLEAEQSFAYPTWLSQFG